MVSHWLKRGYLPGVTPVVGSGNRRAFRFVDVAAVVLMARLRDLGVPLDIAGKLTGQLMERGLIETPRNIRICIDPEHWYLADDTDENPIGIQIDLASFVASVREALAGAEATSKRSGTNEAA